MPKGCLMLRPRTRTSSPRAGRAAGTPCTTSCRVPPTPRDASCPSPCPCPSCTSTPEGATERTLRTAGGPTPRPSGTRSRGTAERPRAPVSIRRAAGGVTGAAVRDWFAPGGPAAGG